MWLGNSAMTPQHKIKTTSGPKWIIVQKLVQIFPCLSMITPPLWTLEHHNMITEEQNTARAKKPHLHSCFTPKFLQVLNFHDLRWNNASTCQNKILYIMVPTYLAHQKFQIEPRFWLLYLCTYEASLKICMNGACCLGCLWLLTNLPALHLSFPTQVSVIE